MVSDGFIESATDIGVVNVHLVSGEDIIGHAYRDSSGLRIEQPVIPQISGDGQRFQVGLLPLRPYLGKSKEVYIAHGHVLYTLPVGEQMESLYRQFTSGIEIVPAGAVPAAPPSDPRRGMRLVE